MPSAHTGAWAEDCGQMPGRPLEACAPTLVVWGLITTCSENFAVGHRLTLFLLVLEVPAGSSLGA